MKRYIAMLLALLLLAILWLLSGCTDLWGERANVVLRFSPYVQGPFTKAAPAECFTKLNVMLFDAEGGKVFDKVRTQTSDEEDFGTLSLSLAEGTYTVVAVGHSSIKSATIKSPTAVQFTASDGEKLTDTFNYCGELTVTSEKQEKTLRMTRVAAMFRLKLTDAKPPESFARMKFDYTGGSANYNPSNGQGITKSTQSELRAKSTDGIYEVYTFPYLSESGVLQITASALDEQGNILVKHVFKDVPVRRNVITSYEGAFFGDMPGTVAGYTGTFVVDPAWGEINTYTF